MMLSAVSGSEVIKRPFEGENKVDDNLHDIDEQSETATSIVKKQKLENGGSVEHREITNADDAGSEAMGSKADDQDDTNSNDEDHIPGTNNFDERDAEIRVEYGGSGAKENEMLKPMEPKHAIRIGKDRIDKKYVFPIIQKEDTESARMYLKYYGLRKFLDTYLPEELNSLYVYFLIKLLGFEIKDKEVTSIISSLISSQTITPGTENETSLIFDDFDDPLEKKQAVRLIKDLQKAINKVLSTRLRLSNFFTIDHFVNKLQKAKKILVLTGAGVSTSLGIPDFRSSEGFYSKIKHLGLDDPQDVFNLDIFMQDPSVFYNIAHMVLPPENIYSPLHAFIKMLQDKGKLLRNYTQNIDNLESYAGIKADKLVQCHGSFATASCITCHWQLPGEKIFDHIRNMELPLCPYCYQKRREYFPIEHDDDDAENDLNNIDEFSAKKNMIPGTVLKSYGVLKPDITFFGEALPSKFHKTIREDILKCDLLICIGTSLKVAPVSEIVNMVPAHVPQVLINRDPVKHAEFDLNLLGFCDDIAALIAQKCQWDIPHSNWETLKSKKIEFVNREKGFYDIATAPIEQIENNEINNEQDQGEENDVENDMSNEEKNDDKNDGNAISSEDNKTIKERVDDSEFVPSETKSV